MATRTKAELENFGRLLGFNDPYGGGAYMRYLDADPNKRKLHEQYAAGQIDLPGVTPVGAVEPFNNVQLSGLEQMAAPRTQTLDAMDSILGRLSGLDVSPYINSMRQSFDPAKEIGAYMNPYIDEVLNRNVQDIMDARGIAQKSVNEQFTRTGSFGNDRQGVVEGMLNKDVIDAIADKSAELRLGGYSDALSKAYGAFSDARNRDLQAGNLAISGAEQGLRTLSGYSGLLRDSYLPAEAMLRAGGLIQDQGQRQLDSYNRERMGEFQFPYSQIDFLKGILQSYPTGSTTTTSGGGSNMWGRLGAVGNMGGAALDTIGGYFGF